MGRVRSEGGLFGTRRTGTHQQEKLLFKFT